jgi:hypothetical protein
MYEDCQTLPELRWVLVDYGVRGPEARDHHQRARTYAGGSQGTVPGELAKVPHGSVLI